jgi:succinoglycan biosynthesis transport protein ExoP
VELRDYLGVLRRRWLTVTIITLGCLALATAGTLLMTPRYTATTRLFFGVEGTGSAVELAQGSSFAERQMTSYAEVATSPLVLDPVISKLALPFTAAELAQAVSANVPTDTVILDLSVADSDPRRAAAIANAVSSQLSEVAGNLSPDRADGSQAVRATILAPASVPLKPSSPKIARNLVLGLVLGLLLGLGTALLRQVLDTKVRSEQDVRAITASPILGVIAFDAEVPGHPVILRADPRGAPAEAIRRLRTNLQFIGVAGESRSIVISSSVPGEGKTTAAINLAVSLADAGAKVLLIDADLRRPTVSEYLGLEGRVGLTTVLIGKASVADVVHPYAETTLDVLPAGEIPPNPSELLGSAAMKALLTAATERYDMVLIDSPPVLPVTDAAVLGRQVDGALVIAGMDRIHRTQIREALTSLETAGCKVLGLVINKIARRDVGSYVYERGYYYSSDAGIEAAEKSSDSTSVGYSSAERKTASV